MIRYTLRCTRDHRFESWFASSNACDQQIKRHLIECPQCGSTDVEKAIMAPRIAGKRKAAKAPPAPATNDVAAPLVSAADQTLQTKFRELHEYVANHAENVGAKFAEEARKIHYGESEERAIYGEAKADDARALIEEGIDILPLPPAPGSRN